MHLQVLPCRCPDIVLFNEEYRAAMDGWMEGDGPGTLSTWKALGAHILLERYLNADVTADGRNRHDTITSLSSKWLNDA